MNIKLVCPMIILDNEQSSNIRKNDVKKLKLLVKKKNKSLISVKLSEQVDIKNLLKDNIRSIINSNVFHLEQVYTLGDEKYYFDKSVDIIYLAITNIENIKKLDDDYELIDFNIKDNKIEFSDEVYKFETEKKIEGNNAEYFHKIYVKDIKLEKELLEIIISYKHLREKLDNSDIIFKFFGNSFTLEDVRIVYELIKEVNVDKSNFRKRIIKYCEEVSTETTKKGYRPSKTYKFKQIEGDIWL